MLKAIILDYNGLLVDDLDIHERAYLYASEKLDLDLSSETIRKYISYSPSQKRRIYYGDIPDETWQKIYELKGKYYFNETQRRNVVFPHVGDVLSSLSSRYKLGLISNTPREYFQGVFPPDLVSQFAELIFADEIGLPKPAPDALFKMITSLDVDGDECCYVGDAILDVEMAKRAGIKVIAVATGDHNEGELRQAGADSILKDLSQLPEAVRRLP